MRASDGLLVTLYLYLGFKSTMPKRPTGLAPRTKYGTYGLRRRIPQDVLSCYPGKKEIVRSLRTKCFATACRRLRVEEAKLTAEWDQHRERLAKEGAEQTVQAITCIRSLTPETIADICAHFEAASLAGEDIRRTGGRVHKDDPPAPPYTDDEVKEHKKAYRQSITNCRKLIARGETNVFRGALEQFLHLFEYDVHASEDDMKRLTRAFAHAATRTNEQLLSRLEGNDVSTPPSAQRLDTPMLSAVTQDYVAHYKKLGHTSMLKKVNGVLSMLVEVVGDKPIGTLRQADLERFVEGVQHLPPHWKVVCKRQAIDINKLIEMQKGEISKGTFDGTYLASLKPFLDHCRRKYQDQGWPMTITLDGVRYTGSRKKSEAGQRAMTNHEMKRLFEGPEMQAFASNPRDAHRYWLPHVSLFTGARMNELCQVNPQVDIKQDESGIWFLSLDESSDGHVDIKKSIKTSGSRRRVPIHSQLIALGFLEYAHHVQAQGHTLLFPGFPPSVSRAAPKAGKWFGQLLHELDLRDDSPGARLVGLHAFRSTLLRQAMLLGIPGIEAITGHSSTVKVKEEREDHDGKTSNVVRTYQGDIPVPILSTLLERLKYDGLTFYKPVPPHMPPVAHQRRKVNAKKP